MNADFASPQLSSWQLFVASACAFFMLAISWSPLLPGLFAINSSLAFLAAYIVFSAIVIGTRGLNVGVAILCAVLVVGSLFLLALTQSMTLWSRTAPLGLLLLAGHQIATTRKLPELICTLLSAWLLVGILMSVIGFFYALNGGEPLLTIANPDGRDNSLFLTTMSGAQIGNVLRPAWVYDEPGAFSFLICATVALRHVLGINGRLSLMLMLGGLITLSLTHLIITIVFLIARLGSLKTLVVTGAAVLMAQAFYPEIDDFRFVLDRLSIEDGRLAGDNRSNQIENFLEVVDLKIVLVGDVACHDRPERRCEDHGDISSSPVSPTYYGGLYFLIAQLAVHGALMVAFFRHPRHRLAALILSLLLLQRPYFSAFGYGLITYLVLFLMFRRERSSDAVAPSAASSPAAPVRA